MNLCQTHWDLLKQAIKDRGMEHLIAKNEKEAAESMTAGLEGKDGPFEPLLAASSMIFGHALKAAGLGLMVPEEGTGKPPCPICFMLKLCECGRGDGCDVNNWITYAADGVLHHAREQGLVGGGTA